MQVQIILSSPGVLSNICAKMVGHRPSSLSLQDNARIINQITKYLKHSPERGWTAPAAVAVAAGPAVLVPSKGRLRDQRRRSGGLGSALGSDVFVAITLLLVTALLPLKGV